MALAAEFLEFATDDQSMVADEHQDDMSETTIVDQSQKIEIAIKRAKTALVKDGSLPDGEPPIRGSDEENRGLAALQIVDDDTGRERSCGKTEDPVYDPNAAILAGKTCSLNWIDRPLMQCNSLMILVLDLMFCVRTRVWPNVCS